MPWGRVLNRAALAVAALLSLALLVGSGLIWWRYHQFRGDIETVSLDGGSKPAKDIDGKEQNILLVADDSRVGMTKKEIKKYHVGNVQTAGTDVMMIIHLPKNGAKATVISLPRDSYVAIPGHGKAKLNAAYVFGHHDARGTERQKAAAGAQLLRNTIQDLTGLTIDHYVSIGFVGFARISDAIGPITVNMCAAVKEAKSGVDLPKGKSTIEGASALAFVRQRYNFPDGLGDFDRVRRQQYFLTAAFRMAASGGGILSLPGLLDAIQKSVVIDDNLDPLELGRQLQSLTANNIISATLPLERFDKVNGSDVNIVDPVAVKAFIQDLVRPPVKPSPSSTGSPISPSTTSPTTKPSPAKPSQAIDLGCID